MLDILDFSFDAVLKPGLSDALGREPYEGGWARAVADFHELVGKAREELEQKRSHVDASFQDASQRPFRPKDLVQIAQKILEKRRANAETVCPAIEELKELMGLIAARDDLLETGVLADLQEGVEIGCAQLEVWDSLRQKLLDLAAARRAAAGEVLRARPVEGEIDHTALSREFIARFPKIRAALAK